MHKEIFQVFEAQDRQISDLQKQVQDLKTVVTDLQRANGSLQVRMDERRRKRGTVKYN